MFVSIFKCKEPVVRSEITLKTSTTGPSVLQTVSKLVKLCVSNYFQETSSWITNYPRVCIANLGAQIVHFQMCTRNQKCLNCILFLNCSNCTFPNTQETSCWSNCPQGPHRSGKLCWVTVGQILLLTVVQIQHYKYGQILLQRYKYGQIQCSEIHQDKYSTVNAYQMDDL